MTFGRIETASSGLRSCPPAGSPAQRASHRADGEPRCGITGASAWRPENGRAVAEHGQVRLRSRLPLPPKGTAAEAWVGRRALDVHLQARQRVGWDPRERAEQAIADSASRLATDASKREWPSKRMRPMQRDLHRPGAGIATPLARLANRHGPQSLVAGETGPAKTRS